MTENSQTEVRTGTIGPGELAAEVAKRENVALPFKIAEDEEYFIEPLGEIKRKPFYSFLKRAFDICSSGVALLILFIPMLVIAAVIKATSPGSVFYSQPRLGLNGKTINVIKFRSMNKDAEKSGGQWSQGDEDPRITKVGKFLRKTRLDELPQLLCIFIGTMSVVGPRPEREAYYKVFDAYVHGFDERLKVKPGLTGLAQVSGGYDLPPQEKVLYDIDYIKRRSLWLDLKIIFKTVAVVFTHEGAK